MILDTNIRNVTNQSNSIKINALTERNKKKKEAREF